MTDAEMTLTGVWANLVDARKQLMDAQNIVAQMLTTLEMLDTVKEDQAVNRVLSLWELEGHGHGWIEFHFIGDDEDPERVELKECVWLDGNVISMEGDACVKTPESLKFWYNKRGGFRVWQEKPSHAEQKAVKWND